MLDLTDLHEAICDSATVLRLNEIYKLTEAHTSFTEMCCVNSARNLFQIVGS